METRSQSGTVAVVVIITLVIYLQARLASRPFKGSSGKREITP